MDRGAAQKHACQPSLPATGARVPAGEVGHA